MEGLVTTMQVAGDAFVALPMFPLFEIVHYVKSAMTARGDIGAKEFACKHPLSSLVSMLILTCGGTICSNLLLGLPLGEPLCNPIPLALASIMWFLVFFCPGDFVYGILSTFTPKAIIVVLKDLRRLHQVSAGIRLALKLHPGTWLLAIAAGTARSSGGSLMVTVDRLMRGAPSARQHEFLKPSYHTKASFFAACALVAQEQGLLQGVLIIPRSVLMVALALAMIVGSLSILALGCRDPFSAVSAVLFHESDEAPSPAVGANTQKGSKAKKND